MTTNEKSALKKELELLRSEYTLSDHSPENEIRGARIREIKALLGLKPARRKESWLDQSCKKYAKYL